MLSAFEYLLLNIWVNESDVASLLSHNESFSPLKAADIPFCEFLGFGFGVRPKINSIIKGYRNIIIGAPVKEVGVEVIFEFGCMDDSEGLRRDFSDWFFYLGLLVENVVAE